MSEALVYIVDDDPGIRANLPLLLASAGHSCRCYAGAAEFLAHERPDAAGCLLLDVRMPGMSGPELQAELAQRGFHLPILFLTAYADLTTGVAAMKQGAADFLVKPVTGAVLLQRVAEALEQDRQYRLAEAARTAFLNRIGKLAPRERAVLALALSGLSNKEIAPRLGISARTVEGHRARIYLKTGVTSLLELARQAREAGVDAADLGLPL